MAIYFHDQPTPESIRAALSAQQEERRAIQAKCGVVIMGCPRPGCGWTVSALSEGRATRNLATHLIQAHDWRKKES